VTAVATVDRWVYAIDTRTGRTFWRYKGASPYGTGPVMDDHNVYAASEGLEGKLTAIRLSNGKRRWEARVGDVGGPLTVRDSSVYGGTQTGTAFAYAASNGRRRWAKVVGATRSGPLVVGKWVALATLTDTLVVLDAATGSVVSRATLPASTIAPLARLDDTTIVMGSPGGSVLAIALPSGRVRWEVTTGAPVFGVPAVSQDTVYALTNRCTVWAIPAAAPTRPDTAAIGCVTEAGPTVVRGGVLVATIGGEVIYYDRASDRRVWTRTVRGELRHPPAVRNGQILIAPILGPVVSFR
jgi:outer membrane protein assembly factor BamB